MKLMDASRRETDEQRELDNKAGISRRDALKLGALVVAGLFLGKEGIDKIGRLLMSLDDVEGAEEKISVDLKSLVEEYPEFLRAIELYNGSREIPGIIIGEFHQQGLIFGETFWKAYTQEVKGKGVFSFTELTGWHYILQELNKLRQWSYLRGSLVIDTEENNFGVPSGLVWLMEGKGHFKTAILGERGSRQPYIGLDFPIRAWNEVEIDNGSFNVLLGDVNPSRELLRQNARIIRTTEILYALMLGTLFGVEAGSLHYDIPRPVKAIIQGIVGGRILRNFTFLYDFWDKDKSPSMSVEYLTALRTSRSVVAPQLLQEAYTINKIREILWLIKIAEALRYNSAKKVDLATLHVGNYHSSMKVDTNLRLENLQAELHKYWHRLPAALKDVFRLQNTVNLNMFTWKGTAPLEVNCVTDWLLLSRNGAGRVRIMLYRSPIIVDVLKE